VVTGTLFRRFGFGKAESRTFANRNNRAAAEHLGKTEEKNDGVIF